MSAHPRTARGNHKSRPVMVFAEGSQVIVNGEPVPVGVARRDIAREQGWRRMAIVGGDGVVIFSDLDGEGRVVLPLAPPRRG